jgi:hypothetical protein
LDVLLRVRDGPIRQTTPRFLTFWTDLVDGVRGKNAGF